MKIGEPAIWHRYVGNYGFHTTVPCVVRKIGKKITVEVTRMNGTTRLVSVNPESLSIRRIEN